MSKQEPKSDDLASRLFNNACFSIPWMVFLAIIMDYISWPIRNCVLVCWIYGSDAYFHRGVRVLYGKPYRFSTGELVPTFPDLVTGFGAFIITAFGLTLLMIFILRFYERHFAKK